MENAAANALITLTLRTVCLLLPAPTPKALPILPWLRPGKPGEEAWHHAARICETGEPEEIDP